MESVIKLHERVDNKDRRFGSSLSYLPCRIEMVNGATINALFTERQINSAISRAKLNPEDIDDVRESDDPDTTFWGWLVG